MKSRISYSTYKTGIFLGLGQIFLDKAIICRITSSNEEKKIEVSGAIKQFFAEVWEILQQRQKLKIDN